MFPEAIRAVREIRPEIFIFENVRGLLRASFRPYFEYIIKQLTFPEITRSENMSWEEHSKLLDKHVSSDDELQYKVAYHLFNAADYGIPQLRQRVIIVGFRSDFNTVWTPPKPTNSEDGLIYDKWISGKYWKRHNMKAPRMPDVSEARIKRAKNNIENRRSVHQPWQTVRDAIGDLPDPESDYDKEKYFDHDFRPGAKIYPGHSGSQLDLPSKTIKAGGHGVPGGENMFIKDDGICRYYTVRESARIQTFPDEYRFSASWTESMRQIGNAVPVKLATIVGQSVMKQLKEVLNGK